MRRVVGLLEEKILEILEKDSRTPVKRVASMLGAKEEKVAAAVKKMEKEGVIIKYGVVANKEKLGREETLAAIEVKLTPQRGAGFDAVAQRIARFPEVRSVYLMSGDYDLLVFVDGKSLKEVAYFVAEKLASLENVTSTATHFLLKKYKEGGALLSGAEESERLVVAP